MLYIVFDQATSTTGYSVFKDMELVSYGKFTQTGEINFRISKTVEKILEIVKLNIDKYPNEKFKIVLEDIQLQGNALTFKQLAQLQGACIVGIIDKYNIEPDIYFASSWKSFNKIKGRSRSEQKRSAQSIVKELYSIKATQDEADAIMLGRYASHKEINW